MRGLRQVHGNAHYEKTVHGFQNFCGPKQTLLFSAMVPLPFLNYLHIWCVCVWGEIIANGKIISHGHLLTRRSTP